MQVCAAQREQLRTGLLCQLANLQARWTVSFAPLRGTGLN